MRFLNKEPHRSKKRALNPKGGDGDLKCISQKGRGGTDGELIKKKVETEEWSRERGSPNVVSERT